MTIVVTFGGDPIAQSPFTVGVAAPLDLSKVTVDNMDGSKRFSCSEQLSNRLTRAAVWKCLIFQDKLKFYQNEHQQTFVPYRIDLVPLSFRFCRPRPQLRIVLRVRRL